MTTHTSLFPQAELTFCTGDIITVFGEIDEDGFYYVSFLSFDRFKRHPEAFLTVSRST